VYFYRSPSGGRVFFDDLGPPWPKHPCTDNPSVTWEQAGKVFQRPQANIRVPAWKLAGWTSIEIIKITKTDDSNSWSDITARRLDNRKIFTGAIKSDTSINKMTPIFVKRPGADGNGNITWLGYDAKDVSAMYDVLCHRTFSFLPRPILQKAMAGEAVAAMVVGRCCSFAFGKSDPSGRITYPNWVDWSIARFWLQRAADGGCEEALESVRERR
jgi:hypothetical protein